VERLGCVADDLNQNMETGWKIFKIVVCGFAIVLVTLIVLTLTSPISHNAKGNRWILIEAHVYLRSISFSKTKEPRFDLSKLSGEEKSEPLHIAGYFDFLIKTNFVWGTSSNREIVIVCQKQFNNLPMPKQGFWHSFQNNPAHVAGYSDGSVSLISPEQFTNLNLLGFVVVDKNCEFKAFK